MSSAKVHNKFIHSRNYTQHRSVNSHHEQVSLKRSNHARKASNIFTNASTRSNLANKVQPHPDPSRNSPGNSQEEF